MQNQKQKINNVIHSDANGVAVLETKPAHEYQLVSDNELYAIIKFQDGGVKEVGVNGLQNEHLLAILISRTEQLNKQFPCVENDIALTHLREAQFADSHRTKVRVARGVEGESKNFQTT